MAEQLWKGRFSKAVDSRVNDFNSSIRFDQRMIAQDMRGSGVHAAMLAKQGIISEKDCEDILSGLASIADDLASGKLEIDPNAEDVHTFVEQTLTARIGDAGKRLHGAGRHDHTVDRIGTACDGGADVLVVVDHIGIARKLVGRHAELLLDGDLSPARDDKCRLGTGLAQAFEALKAQRGTAGARNANDNATGTDIKRHIPAP